MGISGVCFPVGIKHRQTSDFTNEYYHAVIIQYVIPFATMDYVHNVQDSGSQCYVSGVNDFLSAVDYVRKKKKEI